MPAKKSVATVAPVSKAKKDVKAEESHSDSANSSDEDVGEDGLQWWERENLQASKKGEIRWTTLSHNGPYFEPEYVPHGLPFRYSGEDMKMVPAVEEVCTMYAVMRDHQHYHNEVFRNNFFKSWREVMAKHQPQLHAVVRNLGLCDFNAIWNWHTKIRDARKNAPKEEKKRLADEKKKTSAPYTECVWDGRKERVANFRVEPPGLFRGRGKHPLMGKLKTRTYPEDITINIGKGVKVPECPAGHKWGNVIHDQTVTWLAMWNDNVTGNNKYVMLAPNSMIKGMSDREKFERARRLKGLIDTIRADYKANWNSKDVMDQQLGVALYFIDKLALRVGNEKGETEADTVGCCSLRKEHIELKENNQIHLDFLGKDSIRYSQTVEVDPKVYSLIKQFVAGKKHDEDIFDRIHPQQLNDYLKKHMSDLTAKVFRTYNASVCLDKLLRENPPPTSATEGEKLVFFTKCNTEVAILCNHQKAVGKSFFKSQKQGTEKLEMMKKNILRLEDLKVSIDKMGRKPALRQFYAEEDKIMNEWLSEHGNAKQKEDYATFVARRDEQLENSKETDDDVKKSPSGKTSGSKRSRSSKDSKGKTDKKKSKTEEKKNKKSDSKKKTDDDDLDLESLLKKKGKDSKKTTSPTKTSKKAATSPTKKKAATSPKKKAATSPKKAATSPKKAATSPKKKAATSPKKAAKPPAKKTSPKKAGKK